MFRPMTAILVYSHRASVLLQVKWSDSSSTAVTKTHRELEDFLFKVSRETGLWCCILCSFSLVDLAHMPVCQPVGQDATWPDQQGTSICFGFYFPLSGSVRNRTLAFCIVCTSVLFQYYLHTVIINIWNWLLIFLNFNFSLGFSKQFLFFSIYVISFRQLDL